MRNCSETETVELAALAPLAATAGTPMPGNTESPTSYDDKQYLLMHGSTVYRSRISPQVEFSGMGTLPSPLEERGQTFPCVVY